MRQPGQHPARNDLGRPGQRRPATCAADPLSDKPARQQLIVQCAHTAEMAQPAEAMQFPRPCLARRHHREWRKIAEAAPSSRRGPHFRNRIHRRSLDLAVAGRAARARGHRLPVSGGASAQAATGARAPAFHDALVRLPTPPVRACRWRRATTGPGIRAGSVAHDPARRSRIAAVWYPRAPPIARPWRRQDPPRRCCGPSVDNRVSVDAGAAR